MAMSAKQRAALETKKLLLQPTRTVQIERRGLPDSSWWVEPQNRDAFSQAAIMHARRMALSKFGRVILAKDYAVY